MASSHGTYRLSAEYGAHDGDVRAISSYSSSVGTFILSGSRDRLLRAWTPSTACYWGEAWTVFDHPHWVNAAAAISSNNDGGDKVIATGCHDGAVRVYDVDSDSSSSAKLRLTLQGHSGPVCSVSPLGGGLFVTGSWDGTAKVWRLNDDGTGSCAATLPGHENGVCVLGSLKGGVVVTGSAGEQVNGAVAGYKIRMWNWKEGRITKTLTDHRGSVRYLCAGANDETFLSCSNDGTVREWAFDGTPLRTFSNPASGGSPAFLYGCCAAQDGTIVAACDDMCARAWGSNDATPQQIGHPCTVWSVCALPNGDVATGGSDGMIRVFTLDPSRTAPDDVLEAYASNVQMAVQTAMRKAAGKSGGGVSSIDVSKLVRIYDAPSGSSEGEVKMFSKGGEAWAFQWSVDSQTWIEIGPVVGDAQKDTLDGREYDKVLPVELEDPATGGTRKLKIGFNNADNPYVVAQAFIARHGLSENHVDDIAAYIQQNRSTNDNQLPTLGMESKSGADPRASAVASAIRKMQVSSDGAKAIKTLSKMLGNLIEHPTELKFRRINLQNSAFQRRVVACEGGVALLEAVGYVRDDGFLVLADNVFSIDAVKGACEQLAAATPLY